ncbi:MAG TPA: hypothetical protein VFY82_06260, partial [Acidimicrobiales bacterium]|nr:hypothetical protein [Acidimicrobiales bacterium]
MDADDVRRAIWRMAHEITEHNHGLDDLVRHAPDGPPDVVEVEDLRAGNENAPERGRVTTFTLGQP